MSKIEKYVIVVLILLIFMFTGIKISTSNNNIYLLRFRLNLTSSECSIMLSYSDQISVKKSREDHFSKKLMKVQKDTDKTLTQLLTYMNHFIQPVKKLPRKGM